ncbi:Ribokinase-like protein [Naematelia encephala]|uniref:Ribokinase-like protein n=1 Tax=Naematelia encephala TaxID=71784 RepID=A0A1Y2AZX0_9TREE|nr:Ribokinase-like protein [Naematelia encephala]
MSPYILEPTQLPTNDNDDESLVSKPPVLASIGTVLIDVFESASQAPSPLSLTPPDQTPKTSSFPTLQPPTISTPQLSFSSPLPLPTETHQVLGGGALYALIGARIWLPAQALRTLIDRAQDGLDLPQHLERKLDEYGRAMWCFQTGDQRRMITARIRYEGDVRVYQHLTRAPHRTLRSLVATPLHRATYLHVAPPFSPQDLANLLDELATLSASGEKWTPKIVFEPTPTSCHAGQLEWLEKVTPSVEVLSPNHEELLSLYSSPIHPLSSPEFVPEIERLILHLLNDIGVGNHGQGVVVVRCGKLGSCIGTRAKGVRWVPAFWVGKENAGRVKDVTGAGNAFLGGYVAGLSLTQDAYQAALYGSVSSSFVVEQVGLPLLSEDGKWNGDEPLTRVEQLRKRAGM